MLSKRPAFALIFVLFTLTSVCSLAAEVDKTKRFKEQIALMIKVSRFVERADAARLLVIRNSAEKVVTDIDDNVAKGREPVTLQTLRLMQNLIIQYRFSQVFFGWATPPAPTSIFTLQTAQELASLQHQYEQLVAEYGFDDSPYTQITANTFRQMHKLLTQLEALPISSELKLALKDLRPAIGETIAIAEQGDRPKTFERAVPLTIKIQQIYPIFDQVSTTAVGFPLILELQGLNEFYAEFAQVEGVH